MRTLQITEVKVLGEYLCSYAYEYWDNNVPFDSYKKHNFTWYDSYII